MKRWIGFLLAVSLVLLAVGSLAVLGLPSVAFAEKAAREADTASALVQQVQAAKNGETVRLTADVDLSGTFDALVSTAKKGVTLDLGGHTLSAARFEQGTFNLVNGTVSTLLVSIRGKDLKLHIGADVTVKSAQNADAISVTCKKPGAFSLVNDGTIQADNVLLDYYDEEVKSTLSVENNGVMEGGGGVHIILSHSGSKATLVNNGSLTAAAPDDYGCGFRSVGSVTVENNGTITGGRAGVFANQGEKKGKVALTNTGEINAPAGVALVASCRNGLTVKGGGVLSGACAVYTNYTITLDQQLRATYNAQADPELEQILNLPRPWNGVAFFQAFPCPVDVSGTLWATNGLMSLDVEGLKNGAVKVAAQIEQGSAADHIDVYHVVDERSEMDVLKGVEKQAGSGAETPVCKGLFRCGGTGAHLCGRSCGK